MGLSTFGKELLLASWSILEEILLLLLNILAFILTCWMSGQPTEIIVGFITALLLLVVLYGLVLRPLRRHYPLNRFMRPD